MSARTAGLLLDSATNHEQESINTKDMLMNSFLNTSPTSDGNPTFSSYESTAYEKMLDDMQFEVEVLQFALQRRRKALRRQKRRTRLSRFGTRAIVMVGLGTILLAAGITLMVLGYVPIGMGFVDLALTVWCDAAFKPRPPVLV
ncbi:hypothetical protein R6L23_00915 [Streptomyces sp. SR27]|uniref:hypothetical protein n=1 Tax=Streptomyces sp. SR27 TaxID=3076630 RepID=UPI00295B8A2F|nr:hypothetical protein [Streptomyces sp. SR27]MDV9186810.1 hypothetical protein [Streptomyces sp. SR27]